MPALVPILWITQFCNIFDAKRGIASGSPGSPAMAAKICTRALDNPPPRLCVPRELRPAVECGFVRVVVDVASLFDQRAYGGDHHDNRFCHVAAFSAGSTREQVR